MKIILWTDVTFLFAMKSNLKIDAESKTNDTSVISLITR